MDIARVACPPRHSRTNTSPSGRCVRLCLPFLGLLLLALPAAAKSRFSFPFSPCTEKSTLPGCVEKRLETEISPYTPKDYPDRGLEDTMTEQGRRARGFYITPMYLRTMGARRTALAMKRGNLDTVVIDMKDDFGQLNYPSEIPLGQKQRYVLIDDPAAMVQAFHEQGIYVIARLVAFKDSRLPYVRPDLAVRIGARAERLYTVGENWLDAYSLEVQDYLIDVALEIESFGFDEIQFDYIRFPRGRASTYAVWLHAGKKARAHASVIADFLERVDRAVTIPISADVFGLTTLVDGDPRGLGQCIETMSQYLDAISPMMYANGMDTYFRNRHITPHVIELIQCGLQRGRHKAKDIVLRPYLQAYSNGVEHMWGSDFILEQVLAAERAGSDGFLFWNPTMRNEATMDAMRERAKPQAKKGVALLSHRRNRIDAAWCPAKGDVFATPVDRAKARTRNAKAMHKPAAATCAGPCGTSP